MTSLRSFTYKIFNKLSDISKPIKLRPDLRLVFLHTPKCGGSSVDFAIRNPFTYFDGQVWLSAEIVATKTVTKEDFSFSHPLLWHNLQNTFFNYLYHDVPIISGHFSFSREAFHQFGNRYNFVTVLRDPVKRWISHYRFAKMGHQVHLGDLYTKILRDDSLSLKEQLEKFIDHEAGLVFGSLQCMCIGGYNLKFDFSNEASRQNLLKEAKENLSKFAIVGFLEDIADFEKQFSIKFGYPIQIPKKNETSLKKSEISKFLEHNDEEIQYKYRNYDEIMAQDREVQQLFSPEIRSRIEKKCELDIELYNEAKKRTDEVQNCSRHEVTPR